MELIEQWCALSIQSQILVEVLDVKVKIRTLSVQQFPDYNLLNTGKRVSKGLHRVYTYAKGGKIEVKEMNETDVVLENTEAVEAVWT